MQLPLIYYTLVQFDYSFPFTICSITLLKVAVSPLLSPLELGFNPGNGFLQVKLLQSASHVVILWCNWLWEELLWKQPVCMGWCLWAGVFFYVEDLGVVFHSSQGLLLQDVSIFPEWNSGACWQKCCSFAGLDCVAAEASKGDENDRPQKYQVVVFLASPFQDLSMMYTYLQMVQQSLLLICMNW